MRRKAEPENLEKIEAAIDAHDSGWQTYDCTLVTPMYGGGVKPGEVDKEMPIRASAIRGQLRFWWRVACAKDLKDKPKDMFARETTIWGGIGDKPEASKVEVRIENFDVPPSQPAFTYKTDNRPGMTGKLKGPIPAEWAEAYALFPAQGKLSKDKMTVIDEPKKLATPGGSFVLKLRISEKLDEKQRQEVETALRWWASFGGVGARTRRGLGAVKLETVRPVSAEEVSKCMGRLTCLTGVNDPTKAWKTSISRLKDYRHKIGIGRNPSSRQPPKPAGRSLWPEADEIRSISKQAARDHATRIVNVNRYPRAAFGLPIVFHFIGGGEPGDHILEPSDISRDNKRDRLASPLILRPYWNGNQWQPAALLIPGWEQALEVDLKFKNQSYQPAPKRWPTNPVERKKLAASISPMANRADDPLTAFMQFFAEGN